MQIRSNIQGIRWCAPPLTDWQLSLCHTRVGWKVHRFSMLQWSNLTKCGLFFNIVSPAVRTLLPSVFQRLPWIPVGYRSSHPDPRKSPQLRSDKAFQSSIFSRWGTEYSQVVPNQVNNYGKWSTSSKPCTVTHSIHCNHRLVWRIERFTGETGLPSSVFQAILKCHYGTTFQNPELLIQCGFIWKETMQLVSGKVEFNAYQIS